MAELLLGKPVAESLAQQLQSQHKTLTLAAVGFEDAQWQQYANSLCKTAAAVGAEVQNICVQGQTPQQLCALLQQLSKAQEVHGILLQQPLAAQYAHAVQHICVQKDVDCLNPLSVAALFKGQPCLQPATPLAVLHLLDFYKIDLQGKHVVIVGRGSVGKPLALMMLSRNATVTVCHSKTLQLEDLCRTADVLVSACGVAGLITEQCVTPNTIAVDVGLNFSQGKTCGDISAEAANRCKAFSPVPGGVGPVTRMALFGNLAKAAQ